MNQEIIENSSIDDTAQVYFNAHVIRSELKERSSVGDFSKVINSTLYEMVRIDRNNYIDSTVFGRFSYTGKNTSIIHSTIGCFCSISWNVSIGEADHGYSLMMQHSFLYSSCDHLMPNNYDNSYDKFAKKVSIGNDVWIAAGAVIGANAVVTEDIPPYAIAVGVPAKIIKYRFDKEVIELMLQLKWWDWSIETIQKNIHILSAIPAKHELIRLIKESQ